MASMARAAAGVLLALAAIAALLIPTVPCAAEREPALAGGRALVDRAAAFVCHRNPERSFASCGGQWPVCGRCSGLYLGAGAAAWLQLGLWPRRRRLSRHDLWRRALLVAALPTALLWLVEAVDLAAVSSLVRFLGALPLGLAVGAWLGAIARGDLR